MSLLTIVYTLLFYFATATIVAGLAYRIRLYARTPVPLRIPTTPAPTTTAGVVRRMFFEIMLFNSLFKANKWIWLFGWVFHAALLFVLLRKLFIGSLCDDNRLDGKQAVEQVLARRVGKQGECLKCCLAGGISEQLSIKKNAVARRLWVCHPVLPPLKPGNEAGFSLRFANW